MKSAHREPVHDMSLPVPVAYSSNISCFYNLVKMWCFIYKLEAFLWTQAFKDACNVYGFPVWWVMFTEIWKHPDWVPTVLKLQLLFYCHLMFKDILCFRYKFQLLSMVLHCPAIFMEQHEINVIESILLYLYKMYICIYIYWFECI